MPANQTIAADWYKVRYVSDGISHIYERYVGAWLRCNIWHVRGRDRDVLIDSGMGLRPLKAEVSQLKTEKQAVTVEIAALRVSKDKIHNDAIKRLTDEINEKRETASANASSAERAASVRLSSINMGIWGFATSLVA